MDVVNTATSAITEFLNRRFVEHTDILEMDYSKNCSNSALNTSDIINDDSDYAEKTNINQVFLLNIFFFIFFLF